MRPRRPRAHALLAAVAAPVLAGALLAACGSDWSAPHDGPVAVGALSAGFLEPGETPTPEATIVPEAGSWDGIGPRDGYRVVLLTRGDDGPTRTLADAVRAWADAEGVDLRVVEPDAPGDLVPSIAEAVGMGPDLVICAGEDLVDPLAVVSASHLDQEFLVLGAEIAEPTANVTAVDWTGASFRGEGLGSASDHDPASFTPERAATAVRAGAGSVLGGVTGVVVWID